MSLHTHKDAQGHTFSHTHTHTRTHTTRLHTSGLRACSTELTTFRPPRAVRRGECVEATQARGTLSLLVGIHSSTQGILFADVHH